MNDTWNTKGIVLFYVPFRDYDRLYTIYTEQLGKIVVRAQGVRKPKAKLAGPLEPFAETDLFIINAKHFDKIGGAVVQERFRSLRGDASKFAAAVFIAEVIDRTCQEGIMDPVVYGLLYNTYAWLSHNVAHRSILYSFVTKLAIALGHNIAMETDHSQTKRILEWLGSEEYVQVQKLRFSHNDWNQIVHTIRQWLFLQTGYHVQSEQFLV